MRVLPGPVEAAVLLFLAAEGLLLAFVGIGAWPVMLAWGLAAGGVCLAARVVRSLWLRKALAVLLVVACLLFTAEEGLFFLPAAVSLAVAAFSGRRLSDADPPAPPLGDSAPLA